jgi:putative transposase
LARRFYSEINLHVVWRVKENVPVLQGATERHLHQHLLDRCAREPMVICHGIGGTDDHVHLVVNVPPTLPISDWIGELKGGSSHYINHVIANRKVLQWQEGYGVVSFGTKDLPWVVQYVRNQRRHHAKGNAHDRLERIEFDDEGSPVNRAGVPKAR